MPTTVAFDVRANHDTGVSRYGLSLLGAAAPLAAEAGWRLLVVASVSQEERARKATAQHDTSLIVCRNDDGFVRRSPWLRDLLVEEGVDLYFTSHYTADRRCPVPFVFTIHDLTRLRFPEFSYTDAAFVDRFGPAEFDLLRNELAELSDWDEARDGVSLFTRYFRALNQCLVRRARGVITVSRSTARDIRALLGVDPGMLHLVPCAVDTSVFHRRDDRTIQAVKDKLRLAGPYLVFVGLTHPNKRYPWLVEQLVLSRHRFPSGTRLVAVGGYAEQTPGVSDLLRRHGADDFVVHAGRVSDTELAALYSGAAALVTATINEGNNLPPLEALACGSQVIATDIPPLRETLGACATFYHPHRGDDLAGLAVAACRGGLPALASSFRPPEWTESGRGLISALSSSIPGSAEG